MRKINKLNDAIGGIDEKFVEEYIECAPRKRIPWKTIAVSAACFAVILSAVYLPFALRKVPDKGDKSSTEVPFYTGMAGLEASSEVIIDSLGREVLHTKNAGLPDGTLVGQNSALDWCTTSYCYMTHDTPSLLAIKGIKVSSDSYSYKSVGEDGAEYVRICYVSGIRISDMLKENNTSGYDEGDIIYVFDYLTGQVNEDGEMTYFFYKESCIPPEEEAVYLLSTNEKKSYIPAWAKESGLIAENVWDTTGVTSVENFEVIWQEVLDNWKHFEENY
ncbi:MAG: hypothetical protein J6A83_09265 [Clostridia bacterium]|nr:hypothetical protein [Clostridia bacterium]